MDDQPVLNCAEKLKFNTEKEARSSAVVAEHQRGVKLKPYKCRNCEWWHLASRAS